ncbi:hypothetical protein GCM10018952_63890 [Streptosporangium vulgare]
MGLTSRIFPGPAARGTPVDTGKTPPTHLETLADLGPERRDGPPPRGPARIRQIGPPQHWGIEI